MANLSENELKALTMNAMGRSSEAGQQPVMLLGFATNIVNGRPANNSGFSIGLFQWDFGQHPESAMPLISTHNDWATRNNQPVITNTAQAERDLTQNRDSSRTPPWTHDIRREPLGDKLNAFLTSFEGNAYNYALQERHYESELKPTLQRAMRSPAIRNMNQDDTRIALAVVGKIKNQAGNTGRIQRFLDDTDIRTADILIDRIKAAYPPSRNGVVSPVVTGVEHTVAGAKLFNTLTHDQGRLGQIFRAQTVLDPTLVRSGFRNHAEPQILDAMFRHPAAAQRLIQAVNNEQAYQIDNHNNRIKDEAYTVGVTKEGTIYSVDKNGRGFSLPRGGQWQELNDLRELGVTWGNREVTPPSQNRAQLNVSPEAIRTVEALHETLQANVGKQIEAAGAGKFADSMVAECTYQCIKKGITADNINHMFVDTNQNRIFIDTKLDGKIAVIDAFEAAKVDPTERLQAATQTQEEKVQQQIQEQNLQLAQQQERSGPRMG